VIRTLQLLRLRYRLRRIDTALDRLQACHAKATTVAGMLAGERLQRKFEGLAVTRAMVGHRLQRLAAQRVSDKKRWQTEAVRAS
jgi:hypothetical protein